MKTVACDSSTLVALITPEDALHDAAKKSLDAWDRQGAEFTMSVVTWSELKVGAIIRGPEMERTLDQRAAAAFSKTDAVTVEIAERAARLRARRRSLRLPDALILASAQETGADVLITGDKKIKDTDPALVELISP